MYVPESVSIHKCKVERLNHTRNTLLFDSLYYIHTARLTFYIMLGTFIRFVGVFYSFLCLVVRIRMLDKIERIY